MRILLCLMVSQSSLNLFSVFKSFFFPFALQLGCSSLPCLPDCWSVFLPLFCFWFPLVHFFFSFWLLCSSGLSGYFTYFLSLGWSSYWAHLLLSQICSFMTITLNCDFVLFFHLGHTPLSPHFVQCSVCVCVLGRSAPSPALESSGLV